MINVKGGKIKEDDVEESMQILNYDNNWFILLHQSRLLLTTKHINYSLIFERIELQLNRRRYFIVKQFFHKYRTVPVWEEIYNIIVINNACRS